MVEIPGITVPNIRAVLCVQNKVLADRNKVRSGRLVEELLKDFGGLEGFQEQMTDAALSVFGSGYAWLVMDENGLSIMTTANQDTPLAGNRYPLLLIDVWEHAYYLKYYNMRVEYIKNWFSIIHWPEVIRRYHRYR